MIPTKITVLVSTMAGTRADPERGLSEKKRVARLTEVR
jgi:hypothetical protein